MTNIEKSREHIYQKGFGWTFVGAEIAAEHNLELSRFTRRMKDRGECRCPRANRWYCDQDCATYRYHCFPDDGMLSDGIVSHTDRAAHRVIGNSSLDAKIGGDSDMTLAETIPDGAPSVEEITVTHEMAEALVKAIGELTPEERKLIYLAFVEGLPDKEIAERLGLKARTTVSSRKMKALKRIGIAMKDFF